jgi:hypothetical protein
VALCVAPAAAQPPVQWAQADLSLLVAPGSTTSASVTFRLSSPADAVSVAVVNASSGRPIDARVVAGVGFSHAAADVDLNVPLVATAADDDRGSYEGQLEVRSGKVLLATLPVHLVVGETGVLPPCLPTGSNRNSKSIELTWAKASTEADGKTTIRQSAATNVPVAGCRIMVTVADAAALPAIDAVVGWRLLVESVNETALLRLEAHDTAFDDFRASDSGRPGQELAIPGRFAGYVDIKRSDLIPAPVPVRILLVEESLSGFSTKVNRKGPPYLRSIASAGHAIRLDLDSTAYRALTRLAQGYRDRLLNPADKAAVYERVSGLLGRRLETEPSRNAPKSEPIVLFIGIAGLSRIVLLDCLGWPMSVIGPTDCECQRLSDPWQSTFERAESFWAAYIEDEQTSFDTSIDIEFDSDRGASDYDGYDVQNAIRTPNDESISQTALRRVRIGFRRFDIPRRARRSKITFLRQGPSYGLRSWSREFVRYGLHRASLAGGLAVPIPIVERETVTLGDVFGGDNIRPSAVAIERTVRRQPLLAMGFIRFPAFRASAEETGSLWKWAVPDFAFGVAFPVLSDGGLRGQSYMLGGSWELLYGKRIHFLAGFLKKRAFETPFPFGTRLPLGTSLDEVGRIRQDWGRIIGMSVDLARTP